MAFLTSSGSLVTSANIVDGSIINADVNASAAIDASKLTGLPYTKLADVTNAGAQATLASGAFTARRHLRILLWVPGTIADNVIIRFNGDNGANYDNIRSTNWGVGAPTSGDTYLWNSDGNQANTSFCIMDIWNDAATAKYIHSQNNVNMVFKANPGRWNNTADSITSVTIACQAGTNLTAGAHIVVLGMD